MERRGGAHGSQSKSETVTETEVTLAETRIVPRRGGRGKKVGLWDQLKLAYEGLVNTVIRPYRPTYELEDLGPTSVKIAGVFVEREDITLTGSRGLKLECSWWKPQLQGVEKSPCVVVLHGNSSCRLSAAEVLYYCVEAGFSVFAMDCCGSGVSEGDYVSLGWYESQDAETAMEYISKDNSVNSICIYGRSMGAVAALLCAYRNPKKVAAIILDCPFASLPRLALDLVDGGKLNVPKFLVSTVLRMVSSTVKKRAGFDMYKLKPVEIVHKMIVPALFGIAEEDELIPPSHGEELYKNYNGPKQLCRFAGGHNSARPEEFYETAICHLSSFTGHTYKAPPPTPSSPRRICRMDPLPEGWGREELQAAAIKQLNRLLDRAQVDRSMCVEKSDLIELILRVHWRVSKMQEI